MTMMPFAMPAWLPWWVPIAILVPVLLYAAVFLLMPFSVFGVKGRLDLIDARLDEIQGEIRMLSLRLPDTPERVPQLRDVGRPPIPPAPPPEAEAGDEEWRDEGEEAPRRLRGPGSRSEPRLDWPR